MPIKIRFDSFLSVKMQKYCNAMFQIVFSSFEITKSSLNKFRQFVLTILKKHSNVRFKCIFVRAVLIMMNLII